MMTPRAFGLARKTLCCGLLGSVLFSWGVLAQDRIMLRGVDSTILEGKLEAIEFSIETSNGLLVVPVESISSIGRQESGLARIVLRNAEKLDGYLRTEEVRLKQGLYSRALRVDEIRVIAVGARSEPLRIPAGAQIPLILAEELSSSAVSEGREVRLCVAEDVEIADATPFRFGAPALGRIAGTSTGRSLGRGDELGLELLEVVASDGSAVRVTGSEEFSGEYSAGSIVALGVFGLNGSGGAAKVPAGLKLMASVMNDTILSDAIASPVRSEHRQLCEEFLRFVGVQHVPLEEARGGQVYPPFPSPLSLSFPFELLEQDQSLSLSLPGLRVFDANVVRWSLSLKEKKRSVVIKAMIAIYVQESHDKWIDLQMSLRSPQRMLGSASLRQIDAEEERIKMVELDVFVLRDAFDRAKLEGQPLRVWLELRVRE